MEMNILKYFVLVSRTEVHQQVSRVYFIKDRFNKYERAYTVSNHMLGSIDKEKLDLKISHSIDSLFLQQE